MYLIDSTVWVDYINKRTTPAVAFLDKIIKNGFSFGITSIIYQEVLQGTTNTQEFKKLVDYFSTQRFYFPKDEILSYQAAAQIYFNCRRNGLTIRSTIDCLIAQIAIENNLILLHNNKDFLQIKKVASRLKLVSDHAIHEEENSYC